MPNIHPADLTISAVATRTGVTISVLQDWERRFDFPHPTPLSREPQRYSADDVTTIREMLQQRGLGLSLEASIAVAQQERLYRNQDKDERSLFNGIRRTRPDLPVHVFTRRTMLAISHAIEDECITGADRPVLTASFQTTRAFATAFHRWETFLSASDEATVFANFAAIRRVGGCLEVPIPRGDPLTCEWSVVCDATAAGLLVGCERPDHRWDVIWGVNAEVVRLATEIGQRLVAIHAPGLRTHRPLPPLDTTGSQDDEIDRNAALTSRIISYLDR